MWETVFRKVKYGWWSDNCLVKMPDLGFIVDLVNLQKKLSIRVPSFLESLVGSLMWGKSYMILKYQNIPRILLFRLFSKGFY